MSMWTWFKSWWASPTGQVFSKAGSALILAVGTEAADILTEAAIAYVSAAEAKNVPGTTKKQEVMNRLAATAVRSGISIGTGMIDTLVQNTWAASQAPDGSGS